jgi:hypothetical protein
MARRILLKTNVELAEVLGVSAPAVRYAEETGKIQREPDGRWDLVYVVECWRESTNPGLQRAGRAQQFRPWLDANIPLVSSVMDELTRRALAVRSARTRAL